MNEPRKLKRGLSDISPMFGEGAKQEVPPRPHLATLEIGVRIMAISSPGVKGDTKMLGQMLALKLAGSDQSCSILQIASQKTDDAEKSGVLSEVLGPNLKRVKMTPCEFDGVCQITQSREVGLNASQTILIEFDEQDSVSFEKVIPAIDQWIILIPPSLEGLSEAYKMIKASVALNRGVEYFLAVDALSDDPRTGELYEKLSEMVSRRLHVQLNWLGCMPISKGVRAFSWELRLDQLCMKTIDKIDSVEKMALAAYFQPVSNEEPSSILKAWALKNQQSS